MQTRKRRRICQTLRLSVLERQKWTCRACPYVFARGFDFDFDHIVPLKCGGTNAPYNLQALCVPCHRRKTATENMRHDVMDHCGPTMPPAPTTTLAHVDKETVAAPPRRSRTSPVDPAPPLPHLRATGGATQRRKCEGNGPEIKSRFFCGTAPRGLAGPMAALDATKPDLRR